MLVIGERLKIYFKINVKQESNCNGKVKEKSLVKMQNRVSLNRSATMTETTQNIVILVCDNIAASGHQKGVIYYDGFTAFQSPSKTQRAYSARKMYH